MRVIHYVRTFESIHIHATPCIDCFYIPDEDILLYKGEDTFGGIRYSLINDPVILGEARKIANGEIPQVKNVEFSDIIELDYNSNKLRELVENAQLRNKLDKKVKSGIEDILKELENVRKTAKDIQSCET
ncbi:MAG: hypothetical protein J7J92_01555 [Candidatus Aenigmarchaeota archaeon]|nr:hypothetical protein [Candidatus Aenigmarchaeota archaeon]